MTLRTRINLVLVVLLVALAVVLAIFVVGGPTAVPGSTPTEAKTQQYAAVETSARRMVTDFLEVDHTRMDEITKRVLAGTTGTFKKQYTATLDTLKKSAVKQESESHGQILQVGLTDVDDDSATVAVAANSRVKNKGTKGKWETRTWRIQLDMTKVGDRWLTSNLQFVG